MSRLFIFICLFFGSLSLLLSSCGGTSNTGSNRECSPGEGPSQETLEQKKDLLFRDILNSTHISSPKEYLQSAQTQIRIRENASCLKDVEKYIDNLSEIVRSGPTARSRPR